MTSQERWDHKTLKWGGIAMAVFFLWAALAPRPAAPPRVAATAAAADGRG
jgi:hypothetical protein